jgi:TPR repeat protein
LTTICDSSAIIRLRSQEKYALATPSKDSEESKLPHAELNPLLNPLLAEHMGRWAEVYFTNPPEKREQAIAELLRELGNNSSPENISAAPGAQKIAEPRAEHPFQPGADYDVLEEEENSYVQRRADYNSLEEEEEKSHADSWRESSANESGQTCSACGHKNSVLQRFCGMCGASLLAQTHESYTSHDIEAAPIPGSSWSERGLSPEGISEKDAVRRTADSAHSIGPYAVDNFLSDQSRADSTRPSFAEAFVNSEHSFADRNEERAEQDYQEHHEEREFTAPPERGPAFGSIPSFGVESEVESESVPYRYRAYLGFVLAVVIGALLYMIWRNKQTLSGAAVLQSQPAPSAAVPEPAPSSHVAAQNGAAQNSSAGHDARKNSVTKNAAPAKARSAAPTRRAYAPSPKPDAAKRSAPSVTTASSASTANAQSGSEELTMAEAYLQRQAGRARDSQEAAKWLWRSVAKQNLTAALVLSDLYVRGDGVPKSCDQARLLLDVAAKKGSPAAAERLRNLSTSGCQ